MSAPTNWICDVPVVMQLRPLIKRLRKRLTKKRRIRLGLSSKGVTKVGKNKAGKRTVSGPYRGIHFMWYPTRSLSEGLEETK